MKSHLLDFDLLTKASYEGLEGEQLAAKLTPRVRGILRARAKLVHTAVTVLALGKADYGRILQVMSSVADGNGRVTPG